MTQSKLSKFHSDKMLAMSIGVTPAGSASRHTPEHVTALAGLDREKVCALVKAAKDALWRLGELEGAEASDGTCQHNLRAALAGLKGPQ